MLNIILIIIIAISLGIIIFITIKKFSKIALIDLANSPQARQGEIKRQIIEEKLKRNFSLATKNLKTLTKPLLQGLVNYLNHSFKKLIDLEEEYRFRILNLRLKDKIFKDQRINKLFNEAESLKQQEKYEPAEKKLIEILKIDSYSLNAYKGLSELYWLQKDYEQAKETLEYALKLSNNDDNLYRQRARISSVKGDLKKAEADYLQSINLNNQNSINYYELGNIYLQLEDYPKALEMAKKSVSLEENNPKYVDFLLEICLLIKDKVLAQDTWEKLRQVNPENKKLNEFKERINNI